MLMLMFMMLSMLMLILMMFDDFVGLDVDGDAVVDVDDVDDDVA